MPLDGNFTESSRRYSHDDAMIRRRTTSYGHKGRDKGEMLFGSRKIVTYLGLLVLPHLIVYLEQFPRELVNFYRLGECFA